MQNEMIERPAARYGRQRLTRRARRWIVLGLTALVLVAGVAIAAVAFTRFNSGGVKGEMHIEIGPIASAVAAAAKSVQADLLIIGRSSLDGVTGRTFNEASLLETVEVTLSVTRDDPSQPVVCIVRARSFDGNETGRREVLVVPSTVATVQVTTIVKTSRPPVVGDVYGCGTDVPAYLVAG